MTVTASRVHFDEHTMTVDLTDGRTVRVPLAWFPRLLRATPAQRAKVELSRVGLHWEELDEDISIAGHRSADRGGSKTGWSGHPSLRGTTPRGRLRRSAGEFRAC